MLAADLDLAHVDRAGRPPYGLVDALAIPAGRPGSTCLCGACMQAVGVLAAVKRAHLVGSTSFFSSGRTSGPSFTAAACEQQANWLCQAARLLQIQFENRASPVALVPPPNSCSRCADVPHVLVLQLSSPRAHAPRLAALRLRVHGGAWQHADHPAARSGRLRARRSAVCRPSLTGLRHAQCRAPARSARCNRKTSQTPAPLVPFRYCDSLQCDNLRGLPLVAMRVRLQAEMLLPLLFQRLPNDRCQST